MTTAPPISRPLSLGDLLDRAFRLYRAHFGRFLLIAAIFMVPLGILGGLLVGDVNADLMETMTAAGQPTATPDEQMTAMFQSFLPLLATAPLILVANIVLGSLTTLGLTVAGIDGLGRHEASFGETIRRAASRILPYWGMLVVQGLLIGAVLLPVMIVLGLMFGLGFASNSDGGLGGAGLGFGLLMLVLMCGVLPILAFAFLYIYARWAVALPGLVDQGWGPVEALRQSWRLTRGQVGRVIGYLVLLSLLGYILVGVLAAVVQFGLTIALAGDPRLMSTLSSAVNAILQAFWAPIYAIAIVLLYYDLRVRAEDYDLVLRVAQLEQQAGPEGTATGAMVAPPPLAPDALPPSDLGASPPSAPDAPPLPAPDTQPSDVGGMPSDPGGPDLEAPPGPG